MGVLDSIIEAKPTDGLHPTGATDEDQIGATYEELERAMEHYDLNKIPQDYDSNSREYEVMSIYKNRHEANSHKMQMPPIARLGL
jgi:NAD+ synthase